MDLQTHIKRLGLILVSVFLISGCETETEEVSIGWVGIANIDHFLAASRFIEAMGIPADSYPRIPKIPPPEGAMIFMPATALDNVGSADLIYDWIYEGGTAIIMLSIADEAEYWDMENIPIERYLNYEELELEQQARQDVRVKNLYFNTNEQFRSSYVTDFENYISFRYNSEFSEEEDYSIINGYEYGDGYLHIVSSGSIFTNKFLNKEQHATLLWDLVKFHEPSEVQFIYTSELSFFKLLWEKFAVAIVALAVLITFWLWYSAKRFGPLFKTVELNQNKLDDHLTATGYFFTKHKADDLIIDQILDNLRAKLARKVNLPINTEYPEILQECKNKEVLTAEEIKILSMTIPNNEKDRLHYLKQLQKIQE